VIAAVPLENASGELPATMSCARLPALTFGYTAAPIGNSVATEAGLTSLSKAISTIANSPANALNPQSGMALIELQRRWPSGCAGR
jgi:hypothetical protein